VPAFAAPVPKLFAIFAAAIFVVGWADARESGWKPIIYEVAWRDGFPLAFAAVNPAYDLQQEQVY
jgi:hypothetical protein